VDRTDNTYPGVGEWLIEIAVSVLVPRALGIGLVMAFSAKAVRRAVLLAGCITVFGVYGLTWILGEIGTSVVVHR
jgi:hypothetical protein